MRITTSTPTQEIFDYYRSQGFPNYKREDYSPSKELRNIASADTDEYFNGEVFFKHNSSNGYLFSYFPHWIEVECGKSMSLKDAWENDDLLLSLIEKTKTYCEVHHEHWTTNRLRQNAKVYLAKQSVSNFNPIVARILYDMFAYNGIVYDMSMGWGGRLMGFYASSAHTYIGCDPSTKTYKGLLALNKDLGEIRAKKTHLLNIGSEKADLNQWKGQIDLAFTSPPYFDTEKYADEPTQSYIAYPTLDLWLDSFIRPTLEKAYYALKDDGVLGINYADNEVAKAISTIATQVGFKESKTFKLELSSISGKKAKYEPIMVFAKRDIKYQPTLF